MWNWLLSSFAAGATVVLYDGNPNHPGWDVLWRLARDAGITIFGCSASYLNHLRSAGAKPGKAFDLTALRAMSQTGSPSFGRRLRVRLPGNQGGHALQLHCRRHRHQRLFRHRESHPARVRRGAAERRARNEGQGIRREREPCLGRGCGTGVRGPGAVDAPLFLERSRRGQVPERLLHRVPRGLEARGLGCGSTAIRAGSPFSAARTLP